MKPSHAASPPSNPALVMPKAIPTWLLAGPGGTDTRRVRSGQVDAEAKPATAIADYWQRLGVTATTDRVNPQRPQDFEYLATFPAFSLWVRSNDVNGLRNLHSSATPLPSNSFRGGNTSRYMNAQLDALLDSYFKMLPIPERIEVLGKIVSPQVADQVTSVGLYYFPIPAAISNRLVNVSPQWPGAFITWNAHEWDVR